jgi:FAD:protein FMN transferase
MGLFAILFVSLSLQANELRCDTRVEMGTEFKICVYADSAKILNFKSDLVESFNLIKKIDSWMSEWRPETELSRVNQSAGARPVKISSDLLQVLELALDVSKDTDGAFDPTFNAFWGLYNFKKGSEREPTDEEIKERLPLINFKNVEINKKEQTIFLKNPGMKLGLGGIGQGYAVEQVVKLLKSRGYVAGYVDGSGDTYFWGKKPNGELWTTGVRDPGHHDRVLARIYGTDFAITTSGDDEKFFMSGSRRIHHIIDPKTGRPAALSRQATVISKSAVMADAYDTASFVLGPVKAKSKLEAKHFEAVLVGSDGVITFTKGLKKKKTSWGEVFEVPSQLN